MIKRILGYTRDNKGIVISRHLKTISNTITTFSNRNTTTSQYIVEIIGGICLIYKTGAMRGRLDLASVKDTNTQKKRYTQHIELRRDELSNSLTTQTKDSILILLDDNELMVRIRKLTEREVFRLMDVDDADIDKIQAAGISKTQQYKMAGNSIVVSVLYHIFYNLFIDNTETEQ